MKHFQDSVVAAPEAVDRAGAAVLGGKAPKEPDDEAHDGQDEEARRDLRGGQAAVLAVVDAPHGSEQLVDGHFVQKQVGQQPQPLPGHEPRQPEDGPAD